LVMAAARSNLMTNTMTGSRFGAVCHKTITFLPAISLPNTHYSLIARSEALRRSFVFLGSGGAPVKDPPPDSSRPPFSRRTVQALGQWIQGGKVLRHGDGLLFWPTVFSLLHRFWALRI
jgi:hypothetical protein